LNAGSLPLLEIIIPEKLGDILGFQPDSELTGRIEELASKCNEGDLSNEERAEYEGYVRANKFVAILRREARRMAASRP